jgi:hypothetical protein
LRELHEEFLKEEMNGRDTVGILNKVGDIFDKPCEIEVKEPRRMGSEGQGVFDQTH